MGFIFAGPSQLAVLKSRDAQLLDNSLTARSTIGQERGAPVSDVAGSNVLGYHFIVKVVRI